MKNKESYPTQNNKLRLIKVGIQLWQKKCLQINSRTDVSRKEMTQLTEDFMLNYLSLHIYRQLY